MIGESWLDQAKKSAVADTLTRTPREMIECIQRIETPKQVLPISEVPEFADDAFRQGLITEKVTQGSMGSTEHLPIRTDNASDCHVFLIKEPMKDQTTKYDLIHVWAGDLYLNKPGAKIDDLAKKIIGGEAIAITGSRSVGINATSRDLLQRTRVTTKKRIDVASGNRYVSVVYRPDSNEILIRVGDDIDATEVWVYDGF